VVKYQTDENVRYSNLSPFLRVGVRMATGHHTCPPEALYRHASGGAHLPQPFTADGWLAGWLSHVKVCTIHMMQLISRPTVRPSSRSRPNPAQSTSLLLTGHKHPRRGEEREGWDPTRYIWQRVGSLPLPGTPNVT